VKSIEFFEVLSARLVRKGAAQAMRAGAASEQIDAIERICALAVPPALRDWLSLADGMGLAAAGALPRRMCLLGAQEIVQQWQNNAQAAQWLSSVGAEAGDSVEGLVCTDPRVRSRAAHVAWLPIATDEDAHRQVLIDYAPTERGVAGQVIEVDAEATEWKWLAPDVEALWDLWAARIR
jgi:cell wall assembly regulator SMI1